MPVIPDWCYLNRRTLSVSPDGHYAAIGGNPSLHVVSLQTLDEPDTRPVDQLRVEAELLSHHRVLENGATANLSLTEWLDRWSADKRQRR